MTETSTEGPYRDNPLLKEMEALKSRLDAANSNVSYYRSQYEQECSAHESDIDKLKGKRAMRFILNAIYVTSLILWLLISVAAILLPLAAVAVHKLSAEWLWVSVIGVISSIVFFVVVSENRN